MLSPVWSIKRFPDIDEKPMCLLLRAHNQGTWSTAVWANLDSSLCFQLSVHIDLKKRYRIVPKIKSNSMSYFSNPLDTKIILFATPPAPPDRCPTSAGFVPLISGTTHPGRLPLPEQTCLRRERLRPAFFPFTPRTDCLQGTSCQFPARGSLETVTEPH